MSLLRRSKKESGSRRSPASSESDGAPLFKPRGRGADAPGMITGVLPGQNDADAEPSAPGWHSGQELANLGHDDSIEGLTIDQVSVVRIGDRAVVVPVSHDLAERSGFEIVPTSQESLFAIGVRPVPAGTTQLLPRWDAPVAEALRAPEVDVAQLEPNTGADTDADPNTGADTNTDANTLVDDFMADQPEPATRPDFDAVPDLDGFANFDRVPDLDRVPDPNRVSNPDLDRVPDTGLDGLADLDEWSAPVEPARPQTVQGPDRHEWPHDDDSPAWPEVERRVNDRRAGPVLAWGGGDAGTAAVRVPSTPSRPDAPEEARRDVVDSADAEWASEGTRPVATETVRIAAEPVVQSQGEPIVAVVDVAFPNSRERRFGLRIAAGEVVVVAGAGGSGKSSLLRLLAGVEAPATGTVTVAGVSLDALPDEQRLVREAVCAGFVASSGHLVPDLSVIENIELPLLVGGSEPAEARAAAEAILVRWRISTLGDRAAGTLSTTEQRCVLLARALVSESPLVLADDPTVGIAADVAGDIVSLLIEQARLGAAVVIATSDPRVVVAGVRLLTMDAGDIVGDVLVPAAD